jgi:hypothetical protein
MMSISAGDDCSEGVSTVGFAPLATVGVCERRSLASRYRVDRFRDTPRRGSVENKRRLNDSSSRYPLTH